MKRASNIIYIFFSSRVTINDLMVLLLLLFFFFFSYGNRALYIERKTINEKASLFMEKHIQIITESLINQRIVN